MDPLASIMALGQAQLPQEGVGAAPGVGSPVGGSFNLLNSAQSPAASAAVGAVDGSANWGQILQQGISSPISESFNLLNSAQPSTASSAVSAASAGGADGPSTWGHTLQQMVLDVNQQQETAGEKVRDVLRGGPTPVHEAMVATEEANLSFEFLATMRDKVVQAYQQIMQMQV